MAYARSLRLAQGAVGLAYSEYLFICNGPVAAADARKQRECKQSCDNVDWGTLSDVKGIMAEAAGSSQAAYPYVTHLNVHYDQLELVDVQSLVDACKDQWYNQTLCRVNDSVVRLGVMQGEYHWHKHDNDDEFFYVIEGHFLIDLEDRTIDLGPRQGFVVPKGVVHRTRAPERAVILMVENAGIIPTGD